MSKYMWCWESEGKKYFAKSLRKLVHEVLNQYFYDGNDWDEEGVLVERRGNRFDIAFTEEHGDCFDYTVEAAPEAVEKFLKEMRELKERIKKELEEKYDEWGILRREYNEK